MPTRPTPSFTFPASIPRHPPSHPSRHCRPHRRAFPTATANKPATPPEPPATPTDTPAPLSRPPSTPAPTLFNGPEAVLGLVLAAAALLADFARNLSRLASGALPRSTTTPLTPAQLANLDGAIATLQTTLDTNQTNLRDAERLLDEYLARAATAEDALAGLGDSRAAADNALQQALDADAELERIQRLLRAESTRANSESRRADRISEQDSQLKAAIASRESDVENLRTLVAAVRERAQAAQSAHALREAELSDAITTTDDDLSTLRRERATLAEQTAQMEARAAAMAEQVAAATLALDATRAELARADEQLQASRAANAELDDASARAVERSARTDQLRDQLRARERELGELQAELRSRDIVVNEVAAEADQLRSLLAARDAELGQVVSRLESAVAARASNGGDPERSDMSLEEIKANLDAEQLAFSAEISKAELASFDITEADLDPLDRIEKEMEVEGNVLKAGLRKAESAVRIEERTVGRRAEAVEDVLESLAVGNTEVVEDVTSGVEDFEVMAESVRMSTSSDDSSLKRVVSSDAMLEVEERAGTQNIQKGAIAEETRDKEKVTNNEGLATEAAVGAEVSDVEEANLLEAQKDLAAEATPNQEDVGVANQTKSPDIATDQSTAKPTKRRGRQPKGGAAPDAGDGNLTTPKRKRGRPKKKPES